MTIKTTRFDPAEHLDTPEIQAELLDDALATGDAAVITHALATISRARGMTAVARETGLNRATLYGALSDDGNPTLDTLLRLLRVLKIELHAKSAA